MKKIIGILGGTLIVALTFLNMSLIIDVNQNVDLASIIQNARADSEDEGGGGSGDYERKIEEKWTTVETYQNGWQICVLTQSGTDVSCMGHGNVSCMFEHTITSFSNKCS